MRGCGAFGGKSLGVGSRLAAAGVPRSLAFCSDFPAGPEKLSLFVQVNWLRKACGLILAENKLFVCVSTKTLFLRKLFFFVWFAVKKKGCERK